MSSWSVTYLSLLINRNARAVSSEILSRKRGVFFGFVLLLVELYIVEAYGPYRGCSGAPNGPYWRLCASNLSPAATE